MQEAHAEKESSSSKINLNHSSGIKGISMPAAPVLQQKNTAEPTGESEFNSTGTDTVQAKAIAGNSSGVVQRAISMSVANAIKNHAYDNHAAEFTKADFPGSFPENAADDAVITRAKFKSLAIGTSQRDPTAHGNRNFYYSHADNVLVIENRGNVASSTMFRPANGADYVINQA